MHTLIIKARFQNADGSLHHRAEFEQPNLDDKALAFYTKELTDVHGVAESAAGKKEDAANLTAVLAVSVDGQEQSSTIEGISYKGLTKIQKRISKIGDKLMAIADGHAKQKGKKAK